VGFASSSLAKDFFFVIFFYERGNEVKRIIKQRIDSHGTSLHPGRLNYEARNKRVPIALNSSQKRYITLQGNQEK
jgi:hypothetical protein